MSSEDKSVEAVAPPIASDAPVEADQTQTSTPPPGIDAGATADSQTEASIQQPDSSPASQAADDVNYVSLLFRDGLDMPIPGLELFITLPSGQICTAESTAQGAITLPVPAQAGGQAKVEVTDAAGKRQSVCSIDLSECSNAVIIRSPKVKADLPLRPHQQTPPQVTTAPAAKPPAAKPAAKKAAVAAQPAHVDTKAAWWSANGALQQAWAWLANAVHLTDEAPASASKTPVVAKTLSKAGQPVTVIAGPECPNKDNLRLGRNNVYREAILGASKRLGLIPQSLCALMDCEAGKVPEHIPRLGPDGKQLTDKKGKALTTTVRELWNANAGNAQSGAAGLTQFLSSTWLGHVLIPGRYIHTQSVANGWVKKETDAKGKSHWGFVLSNGETTTEPFKKHIADANVKKCLAMRMDPTWSINAAADYGNANLKLLEGKGFKLTGLSDMDKAKLMYLMHHEGEGSGPLFISNKLASAKGGVDGLRSKFATQLGANGAARANELIDQAGGDVEMAYRKWLTKFIDANFATSTKYFCSAPIRADELSDLMDTIGGQEL